MRQITCAVAAVLMTAALGCSPRDRQETANNVESAAEDVRDEVGEGAAEVREEVRDFSYTERDELRSDINLRLNDLDAEIADLERDTKRGVDNARDSALVDIRAARKAVARDLDRLASATESNWEEVERSVKESFYALDAAVRRERPDAKPMGGTGPS